MSWKLAHHSPLCSLTMPGPGWPRRFGSRGHVEPPRRKGLGAQSSRVQREPFTDKEIWGSVKAGQSPTCPQSWPRDLTPPTPSPACLSLKQGSYPGHLPRKPTAWKSLPGRAWARGSIGHRPRPGPLPHPHPWGHYRVPPAGVGYQDQCSRPDTSKKLWQGRLDRSSGPVPCLQAEVSPSHSANSGGPALGGKGLD